MVLGELVDALRPEAPVFRKLASNGEASGCGVHVVLATLEKHCKRCAVSGGVCVKMNLGSGLADC